MSNIREQYELRERDWLSPRASMSARATRQSREPECAIRTAFQRDRDRIIHSKAFRRLKYKTQVFLSPTGDHMRTRLTHTLEVTQIARTIARALNLNEDLTEAIGLGHDLGHTPFGHAGERALARVFPGFRHNEQSLRIVDSLERDGHGLNLTDQTRDGILRHSKTRESIVGAIAGVPQTLEAQVVKISDGIAYINHDFDDAVRGGMVSEIDLPDIVRSRLGTRHSERINTLVSDVICSSSGNTHASNHSPSVIVMSQRVTEAANAMRDFLFERVYDPINHRPATLHAERVVEELFEHFMQNPEEIPSLIAPTLANEALERRVADSISGMTDRYALRRYEALFTMRAEEF